MAEPSRVSALDGKLLTSLEAGADADAGVRVQELRPPAMAAINGAPAPATLAAALAAFNLIAEPAPRAATKAEGMQLLWCGPGQYLVLSNKHREQDLARSLAMALEDCDATVVDVSHARSVLRLQGKRVRDVLAKGCALDVDALSPGDCAPTLLSDYPVLLHCDSEQVFDIYVGRSFAECFLAWLMRASREFGVQVLPL